MMSRTTVDFHYKQLNGRYLMLEESGPKDGLKYDGHPLCIYTNTKIFRRQER